MAVTRERDGEAAGRVTAGWKAFEAGARFDVRCGDDWCAGWLAAAQDARQRLQASADLIAQRDRIAEAMREAYAAFRALEGVSKLRPGDRSRMNSAAVRIGASLPYVEAAAAPSQVQPARGRRRT